jgi:hypothetical protein
MDCKTSHKVVTADFHTPLTLCKWPFVLHKLTFTSSRVLLNLDFSRSRGCKSQLTQHKLHFYKPWYVFVHNLLQFLEKARLGKSVKKQKKQTKSSVKSHTATAHLKSFGS